MEILKGLLLGILAYCFLPSVEAQPNIPPSYTINLQVAVANNGNGTQNVVYTLDRLPINSFSTVLYLYRVGSTGTWNTATVNGGTNPTTCTMPLGTYQYAEQFYYADGTNSIIIANTPAFANNANYVRTWIATAPEQSPTNLITRPVTDVKQTTEYFDGLGRPMQTVSKQMSPAGNDLVSTITYDQLGRETYNYLPFVSNTISNGTDLKNDGNFKSDPYQQQAAFYSDNNPVSPIKGQGETYYYSQSDFEPSPINRITKTFASGNNWVGSRGTANEKYTRQQYLSNNANDNVIMWSVGSAPAPTNGVNLQVSILNNGNGTQTVTYTWNPLSNVGTVLLLYSPLGSNPTWTDASAGGSVSPRSATIPTGNYQYAIQLYYTDGTPTQIIQVTNTLQASVVDNGNGSQTVTYTWGTFSNVGTVLLLYSPLGDSPTWTDASAGGAVSPRSVTIPTGNYQYAIQLYYTDGTPTQILQIPNSTVATYTAGSYYPSGELFKYITTDEQGKQVVEFKDLDGKVILKKVQLGATVTDGYTGWLCTYYIYDDFGLLRLVMPPLATNAYLAGNAISTFQDNLCFRYEYDSHHRMTIRKEPGAGEVRMVYDARNRVVLTQDANLRAGNSTNPPNQWIFTKYDALNRPVMTGSYTDNTNTSQAAMQLFVNGQVMGVYETYTPGAFPQYTLTNSFPSSTASNVLTVNYYDDYKWVASTGTTLTSTFDATSNSSFLAASNSFPYPQALTQYPVSKSLPTGSVTKVLSSSNQYLYSVNFFDNKDRIIQTQSSNITTGIDETTNQYSFDGRILISLTKNNKQGTTNPQTNTIVSQMSYDAVGRLTGITKSITGLAGTVTKSLVSNTYNEIGQIQTKTLGPVSGQNNGPVDNLTYDYNVRGWLLGINRNYINSASTIAITNAIPAPGNYFGEELAYDKLNSLSGMTFAAAQFNGNIAGTVWKSTGDAINRKYDFIYDNANRLTAANFSQITTDNALALDFSANNLQYDANGNILYMNQKGYKLGSPTSLIDELKYNYFPNNNQLQNVVDQVNFPQTILGDFRSSQTYMNTLGGTKNDAAKDYAYDNNGNLTKDLNKDIGTISSDGITYNYLNLPEQITFANNKGTIQYTYDASGNKLQKITTENNGTINYNGTTYSNVAITTTTTYMKGFVYQSISYTNNTTLNASPLAHGDIFQFAGDEEGRIRGLYYNTSNSNTITGYAFDYFLKDHLGNTRMVLTDEPPALTDLPYKATMEPANAVAEGKLFTNIANHTKPGNFDNDNTNQWVAFTNCATKKTGPSLVLKVMAGDQLTISTYAYYEPASGNNYNASPLVPATDLLINLLNGITMTGGSHSTFTDLQNNSSVFNSASQTFLNQRNPANVNVPKAYLNYFFLDDQFQYAGGYAIPITSASSTSAKQLVSLAQGNPLITVPKNGWVYIYVSNESNYNVYFDDLLVTFKRGPILEDNTYYPFGLTMAGISDKALKFNYSENKYRFGGKELQNNEFSDGTGLEEYDFGARMQDPQLGVWHNIDLMADKSESFSPYIYTLDNPIKFIDPNGMDTYLSGEAAQNAFSQLQQSLNQRNYGILTDISSNFLDQIAQNELESHGGESDENFTIKGVYPVYETITPSIYGHIRYAQNVQGYSNVLIRAFPGENKRINRPLALRGWSTNNRVLGYSVDEYPVASSIEGGYDLELNRPVSTALVPVGEQEIQRRQLSALYTAINVGDRFLVLPLSNKSYTNPYGYPYFKVSPDGSWEPGGKIIYAPISTTPQAKPAPISKPIPVWPVITEGVQSALEYLLEGAVVL